MYENRSQDQRQWTVKRSTARLSTVDDTMAGRHDGRAYCATSLKQSTPDDVVIAESLTVTVILPPTAQNILSLRSNPFLTFLCFLMLWCLVYLATVFLSYSRAKNQVRSHYIRLGSTLRRFDAGRTRPMSPEVESPDDGTQYETGWNKTSSGDGRLTSHLVVSALARWNGCSTWL